MLPIKTLIILLIVIPTFIFVSGMDTREPKILASVTGAALVILSAFYFGMFKPVKNKWLLIFLAYIPLCIFFSPKPNVIIANNQIANFYVWKASLYLTIFALFIVAVYSIDFKFKDKILFLKVMFYSGFVMACYVYLQFFNIDQFFAGGVESGKLGGFLGNPNIVTAFIAMMIPLALYFKKYIHAVFMGVIICLTSSAIGQGALVLSLLFLVAVNSKKGLIAVSVFMTVISILSAAVYFNNNSLFKKVVADHGRFAVWNNVISDLKSPKEFPFTGTGPGSFPYIYHIKHPNPGEEFLQAHNEYVELLFDMGIAGVIILFVGITEVIKDNIKLVKQNRYRKYLLTSFICVLICAGGLFVWHIGPIIIAACILLGLLMKPNEEETNETSMC